jgi:hypothetical protein
MVPKQAATSQHPGLQLLLAQLNLTTRKLTWWDVQHNVQINTKLLINPGKAKENDNIIYQAER